MINNRQNGRRRGRGGGGPRPNNVPSAGNRQDNRQRGNAAQLLEKYKAMARDSQLAGDRVQTEYYLQFAEHYYRVLNENRARFEEQRRTRDDYSDDEDGDDEGADTDYEARDDRPREERAPREERQREERAGREERQREDRQRDDRPREERSAREDRPAREERNGQEPRSEGRRNGSARRAQPRVVEEEGEGEGQAERIALESLPPAIAAVDASEEKPRRRLRRPRTDGEEIAPAA